MRVLCHRSVTKIITIGYVATYMYAYIYIVCLYWISCSCIMGYIELDSHANFFIFFFFINVSKNT